MKMIVSCRFLRVSVLLLVLCCSACSQSTQRKPTFPVRGKVFWKDKNHPAAHAQIVFQPMETAAGDDWPGGFPQATADKDGAFALQTYEPGDGAPAGRYKVLITWFPLNPKSEEDAERDRLNGRYSNRDRPVWTKTVTAGENDPREFVFVVK